MILNSNDADEALAAKRKAVFEDASLHTPSFKYDIAANGLGCTGGLTIQASFGIYALGIFVPVLLAAATPVVTIIALTEFGRREAEKLRRSVTDLIAKQPDKLDDEQLITIAHAINITFISPLWPIKARVKRQEIAELRQKFAELHTTSSVSQTKKIVGEIHPVTLSWEPINDDFTLKKVLEKQVKAMMIGYASRAEAKRKKVLDSPNPKS